MVLVARSRGAAVGGGFGFEFWDEFWNVVDEFWNVVDCLVVNVVVL